MCWAMTRTIRCAWRPSAVQQPDGGRRRALLLSAMLFAGVGHRDWRLCAEPMRNRSPCAAARGRLAAVERSAAQRRLEPEAAEYGTLGMGLRVQQRVLSGYRRYRHGDAGAEPVAGIGRGGAEGLRAAGPGLAAGDAVGRWRMGGLRRR